MTGDSMRKVLNATGCYRLTGESSADWELNACAAELDRLEGDLEALLWDLFAATASRERLEQWEALFRPQSSVGTLGERRLSLSRRFAMNPGRFQKSALNEALPATGLTGALEEDSGGLRVLVGRLLGLTKEEVLRELDEVLPAHLSWVWDDSVTWTALDSWMPEFGVLDGKELSWESLDGLTRQELESLSSPEECCEEPEEEEN